MIRNWFRFLGPLILALLMVGCQTAASIEELTPTAEIVRPSAAIENSPTPQPSVTATAAAVTLPETAETPEVALTPTVTVTPAPTATPTETPIPAKPVEAITLAPIIDETFVKPLYLTHAQDDRLFVVEQAGIIHIIRDGALLEMPFLDIRSRIGSTQLEQGLLGLAFHPDYAETGTFFVNYTNLEGDTQISRFAVDPDNADLADPNSETKLLTIEQPFPNHNGGQILFGPDGYLYVTVGDGGSANDPFVNGQNTGTLLGTILRLDVDYSDGSYSIPFDNPFVDDDDRLNEIWAWGLRNPWRISFDRSTGDLFIADVGQNLWEEVHFQPEESSGGENYGWNIMEGFHCFPNDPCDTSGLELPIFEYSHQQGCSITGGYMYRGMQYPELYGNYFVADYCQGTVWRLFPEDSGEWSDALVHDSGYVISSFGEDAAGELYILDHDGGSIYQIRP